MSVAWTRAGFVVVGVLLLVAGALSVGAVWFLGLALGALGIAFLVGGARQRHAADLRIEMRRMASNPASLKRTTISLVVVGVLGVALVAAGGLGLVAGGIALLLVIGCGGFVIDAWRAARAADRAGR